MLLLKSRDLLTTKCIVVLFSNPMTAPAFGGMTEDSPVKFPEKGALPAKYAPDRPSKEHETPEEGYYIFSSPERSLAQIGKIQD